MVKIDSQRRIYIPKDIPLEVDKAIILPFGTFLLLIPIPEKIIEIDVKGSIQELKRKAEERAREEAVVKLRNREQS